MQNYQVLSDLLGLMNVQVTKYQLVGDYQINLFIQSTAKAALCPHCQKASESIHEHSPTQEIRDLPMWNRRCWLHYRPRRFRCDSCDKTFVERIAWREPGYNYTRRYEQHIFERTRKQPIAHVAQEERMSEDIVQGIFNRYAQKK